jgi:hypothetical protein
MRKLVAFWSLLLGSAVLSAGAPAAPSADLCVGTQPGCFATIQAAVDAAGDGDRIRIAPGTFQGGITILKDVELVGAGAGATTIEGGGPVITIGAFVGPGGPGQPTVSISRVTITGGLVDTEGVAAGGGVLIPFAGPGVPVATVAISDSVITGNRASPSGLFPPGPFCGPSPCAVAWGGGIDNGGDLTLTNTRISDNVAGSTSTDGSAATIAQGGGIRSHPDANLVLRHSLVSGNRAATSPPNGQFADGGGIADDGTLVLDTSVVTGNTSEVSAAVASTFPFDIRQSAMAGGIFSTGSATIARSIVSRNSVRSSNTAGDALALAGGIDGDDEGTLFVLSDSDVAHNEVEASVPDSSGSSAVAAVGGVSTRAVSTVRATSIRGNHVRAESASGFVLAAGGGLGNVGQTTLLGTLVIGNSASADGAFGAAQGGGINNVSVGGPDPRLTLSHSVVAANRLHGSPAIALQGGGIFTAFPVTLTRTLVAGNEPDQCFGC